jgi:hypothetical protein
LQNHLQNSIHIRQRFIVPKSQHAIASAGERLATMRILCRLLGMLLAVKFDHQL